MGEKRNIAFCFETIKNKASDPLYLRYGRLFFGSLKVYVEALQTVRVEENQSI